MNRFRRLKMVKLRLIDIILQKLLLVFLILSSSPSFVHGQQSAQKKAFSSLGVSDGLSQSSVLSIHRDKYGFMWLGTRDGLNRYDAYQFNTYKHVINDSTKLGGNVVNGICSDSTGNLWIANNRGLSVLNRSTGSFKHYVPEGFTNINEELRFVELIDGEIYACGWSGTYKFDRDLNTLVRPVFSKSDPELMMESASGIWRDADGRWWLATTRKGLYVMDSDGTLLRHYHFEGSSEWQILDNRIEAVHFHENGTTYVATYGAGLYCIDTEGKIAGHWHRKSEQAINNDYVRCLEADQEGFVWAGTLSGINLINPQTGETKELSIFSDQAKKNRDISVRSLQSDPAGIMWVGTYHDGLALHHPLLSRFLFFGSEDRSQADPSTSVISAFAENDESIIYAASERGGIDIYNPENSLFSHASLRPEGQSDELLVKSMCYDEQLGLLLGTFKSGIHLFSPDNKKLTRLKIKAASDSVWFREDLINCITPANGTAHYWLGTDRSGGIHLANIKEEKLLAFSHEDTLKKLINKAPVKHILQDRLGNVWLATKGSGLIAFHPSGGVFFHDQRPELAECNHLLEDDLGNIWISTNDYGVVKFDLKTRKFYSLSTTDGLLNNSVLGCVKDAAGNIWAGLLNGVAKIDPNDFKIRNYDYSRGFPLFEINEGAVFASKSGYLLFGGKRGWSAFNPQTLGENEYKASVVFTDIQVMNESITEVDDLEKRSIHKMEELTLEHHQNVVTFIFAELNYINPANNTYAYILEGFDKDWVISGQKRDVTYTNLPEGNYVLRVRGSNNDGIWNEDELELRLHILPPPWRTWWAFLLYALFIVGGILLIRTNALRSARLRENLRLGVLEKERIEENHRLKLQFFTDVSHEIRTPLTLIVNPLEDLLSRADLNEELRKSLKAMRYNIRRLLLLVNQLLELRKIEMGKQNTDPQPIKLLNILGSICHAYRGMADKTGIKLSFDADLPEHPVLADVDKLEKVLLNLLSNAFKFTPQGGEVCLSAKAVVANNCQHCVITVSDTGIGVNPEDQDRIFERFYKGGDGRKQGSGIGLSLVKSLVSLMGGTIHMESTEGKGSRFIVELVFKGLPEGNQYVDSRQVLELPPEYIVPIRDEQWELDLNQSDGSQPTLLIVEDNEELRNYVVQKFRKSFRVIQAESAEEALDQLKDNLPDLVVSDIMLPGMDGVEFCQKLKSEVHTSHLPFILVTARQGDEGRLEGLRHGADDYLMKPFMMEELEARINNILRMRQKLKAHYRQEGRLDKDFAPNLPDHDKQLLAKLDELIEKNIGEPNLSVEALSDELGLSRVHLYRKLKSLVDLSPSSYVRHYRLRKAESMLRHSKMRVSEIAYAVGFQDLNYFGKSFKKLFGTSPSAYRERVEKGSY